MSITPTPPSGRRRDFNMRNYDKATGRTSMVTFVVSSVIVIAVLVGLAIWLF